MNISRFFGSTNREALRQVRLALGPEALIVSNRRVNGGVEILATDPTSAQAATETASSGNSQTPVRPGVPSSSGLGHGTLSAQPGGDLMGAIGEMRGALENRIDELLWGNQLRGAPQVATLFQALLGYGFSTALLRAMLKKLPAQLSAKAAFQWARNELLTHLPVLPSEDDLWRPGLVLALVGPTGVGKTTTIAKLAARCVRRAGAGNLVLITTDTYRIGAHEQLKIYGQILKVPVHVVQDVNELKQVMQAIRPEQSILIDNVGISQRDSYVTQQAAMLAGSGRHVHRLLVLNASSHGDTLDEVARTYSNDGGLALKGCIITKVDEASRLGPALDTAIRYQLPIHYVSNGQKVPENLVWLSASELVDRALVHNKQSRALYSPSEADLAALMSFQPEPENKTGLEDAEKRRKRLLPALLSVASDTGKTVSAEDLSSVCHYIDESIAASEAYDLWRAATASPSDGTTVAALADHMVRVAQNDLAENGHRWVLAVHDQSRLGLAAGARGTLRTSFLLDDRGRALTTATQQLGFADGWQSSCGAAAQVSPAAADALYHQIAHLNQHKQQLPLIHLFDGATPSLLRRVSALDVAWLTQSSSVAKVQHQSYGATVAAVAKTLVHKPVNDPAILPMLARAAGVSMEDTVLWVAHETVQLTARQQDPLPVQLVSVRLLSRHDGTMLKTLYGLSNRCDDQLSSETLGAWLLLRSELKSGLRHTVRAWQILAERLTQETPQKLALLSAQLGLAGWQLAQDPAAEKLRDLAATVVGRRELNAQATVPALLKLFTLKEITEA